MPLAALHILHRMMPGAERLLHLFFSAIYISMSVMQDAVGELGNRPIHLAAAAGHTAVVKLLLRQGANVVSHPMPCFV